MAGNGWWGRCVFIVCVLRVTVQMCVACVCWCADVQAVQVQMRKVRCWRLVLLCEQVKC